MYTIPQEAIAAAIAVLEAQSRYNQAVDIVKRSHAIVEELEADTQRFEEALVAAEKVYEEIMGDHAIDALEALKRAHGL